MKEWIRHAACAGFVVLAAGAGAAGDPDSQSTAWERFKAYTHQEQKAAVAQGRKLIATIDLQLAEMKRQARNAKQETVAAHKANIAELEARKKAAQAELDKLGRSSAAAWDATKDGFSQAYKELHRAYDKARAASQP